MKAGLNLYSVRTLIDTEEKFLDTAQKLKKMGYSYLQFSGGEIIPDRIKRVSEQSGLPVILTHAPMARIINDTEKLMEDHAVFGCKNIGLGMMSYMSFLKIEEFKKNVEDLNKAAEKMQKNGFTFFYHNHHSEFYRLPEENKTIIEYMIDNAPYIHFVADTYWIQKGGADVCETLAKMRGRIECVHLKDFQLKYVPDEDPTKNGRFDSFYAPVGDGNLNFKKIVQTLKDCGTQYYLVEQDDACKYPDPLEQVERSIRYITNEL